MCRNYRTTFGVGFLPPLWALMIKFRSSGLSSMKAMVAGSRVEEEGPRTFYLLHRHTPQSILCFKGSTNSL